MSLSDALFDWDEANEEDGNTAHVAEHGLTADDVEGAFREQGTTFDVSHSSGRPMAFGTTTTGRFIAIVFEVLNPDDPLVIRVITAYDVPQQPE